ncbi:hypothetical protein EEB14_55410 [Rhodococcus sp. WS4]|nr:hypothetical protein EEB14_55410 [Rhodococcus sp. WS4]
MPREVATPATDPASRRRRTTHRQPIATLGETPSPDSGVSPERTCQVSELLYVADVDEIRASPPVVRKVGRSEVLVCAVGSQFFVVENRCSHMARPLAGGRQIGHMIVCPVHSGQFDLRDGSPQCFPATRRIKTYDVVVDSGSIWIPEHQIDQ